MQHNVDDPVWDPLVFDLEDNEDFGPPPDGNQGGDRGGDNSTKQDQPIIQHPLFFDHEQDDINPPPGGGNGNG